MKYVFVFCFVLLASVGTKAYAETLTIQPGYYDGKDTFYSTVFHQSGLPEATYMGVGGWADNYYSYIEFDVSELPTDAEIVSAELQLFQETEGGNYNEIKALRITESWGEMGVSLANNPSSIDDGQDWTPAPSVIGWWETSITDIVKGWHDGQYPNYGLKLVGRYSADKQIRLFYTSEYIANDLLRPKLVIEYTLPEPPPEPEKTAEELVGDLVGVVNTQVEEKSVKNSYFAHIDKLLKFFDGEQVKAALNQIGALLKKVSLDSSQSDIAEETALEIETISTELEERVLGEIPRDVPLMTQVASPFPEESAVWAIETYANGAGNNPSDPNPCGVTIAECGCALTSLAMIGNYYELGTDIEGNEINPSNMNAWLEENGGYDAFGNMWWSKALAYLGEETSTGYVSNLSFYSADRDDLDSFVDRFGPAIAFNSAKGHYFVVSDMLEDGSYSVRDPLWYLTSTTNDEKDTANHVQDYDNVIDKVQLFKYGTQPRKISKMLEVHLASPAELLITDSKGRKVGFDPESNQVVQEIPGSYYDQTAAIYSTSGVESEPHYTKKIFVNGTADEIYSLKVIGTGAGKYTLSTLTVEEDGVFKTSLVEGETTPDQVDAYLVDLDQGDGELESIIAALYEAAEGLAVEDREKIVRMLQVVEDKVEKSNVVAAERKTASLLAYVAHTDVLNAEALSALLAELLNELE